MVKTKKIKREEDSEMFDKANRNASFVALHNALNKEKTLGMLYLEGENFDAYFNLDMQMVDVELTNKAEINIFLSQEVEKTLKRDASAVAIYGEYDQKTGNFIGRPKMYWCKPKS